MSTARCATCKHFVPELGEIGLCTYTWLFVAHVREWDWCECYELNYFME